MCCTSTSHTHARTHASLHTQTHIAGHELILLHESLVLTVEVKHLADALGRHLSLLGAGEGVVVAGHVGHDGALIWLDGTMDVCTRTARGALKTQQLTHSEAGSPRDYNRLLTAPS